MLSPDVVLCYGNSTTSVIGGLFRQFSYPPQKFVTAFIATELVYGLTITNGNGTVRINVGATHRVFDHFAGCDKIFLFLLLVFALLVPIIHEHAIQNISGKNED